MQIQFDLNNYRQFIINFRSALRVGNSAGASWKDYNMAGYFTSTEKLGKLYKRFS